MKEYQNSILAFFCEHPVAKIANIASLANLANPTNLATSTHARKLKFSTDTH